MKIIDWSAWLLSLCMFAVGLYFFTAPAANLSRVDAVMGKTVLINGKPYTATKMQPPYYVTCTGEEWKELTVSVSAMENMIRDQAKKVEAP